MHFQAATAGAIDDAATANNANEQAHQAKDTQHASFAIWLRWETSRGLLHLLLALLDNKLVYVLSTISGSGGGKASTTRRRT